MKPVTRPALRRLLEHAARGALVVAAGCEPAPPPPVPSPLPSTPPPVVKPKPPAEETLPFGCVDGRWDPSPAYPEGMVFLGHGAVLARECARKVFTGPICESRHLKPANPEMPRYPKVIVTGDNVETFDQPEAMIGPIDTPMKAALRMSVEGAFIDCGVTTVRQSPGGYIVRFRTTSSGGDCSGPDRWMTFEVASNGTIREVSREDIPGTGSSTCVGRRPTGFAPMSSSGASAGVWLARCAGLEAASVHAFHELADELAACGAPGRLVAQARVFADDEVRHAALTDRLAARFGGRRDALAERPRSRRSLLEIAVDNAVEGCVRETFGALLAMVQAASATDGAVARGMAEIADEELSHAAFSWELAAWANARLAPAERRAVTALAEAELVRFDPAADAPAADAWPALGWPTPAALEQLRVGHAEAVRALWS